MSAVLTVEEYPKMRELSDLTRGYVHALVRRICLVLGFVCYLYRCVFERDTTYDLRTRYDRRRQGCTGIRCRRTQSHQEGLRWTRIGKRLRRRQPGHVVAFVAGARRNAEQEGEFWSLIRLPTASTE